MIRLGNTTVSRAANTNPSQYTGRKNELNGLYFYRNRFHSPLLSRFISEDPLAFIGSGPNFYSYVFDRTNLVDPFGPEGCASVWSKNFSAFTEVEVKRMNY